MRICEQTYNDVRIRAVQRYQLWSAAKGGVECRPRPELIVIIQRYMNNRPDASRWQRTFATTMGQLRCIVADKYLAPARRRIIRVAGPAGSSWQLCVVGMGDKPSHDLCVAADRAEPTGAASVTGSHIGF